MKKMLIFLVVIVAFGVSNSAYAGGINHGSFYYNKINSSGKFFHVSASFDKHHHGGHHHGGYYTEPFYNRITYIQPADMSWSYPPQSNVQNVQVINIIVQTKPEKRSQSSCKEPDPAPPGKHLDY